MFIKSFRKIHFLGELKKRKPYSRVKKYTVKLSINPMALIVEGSNASSDVCSTKQIVEMRTTARDTISHTYKEDEFVEDIDIYMGVNFFIEEKR